MLVDTTSWGQKGLRVVSGGEATSGSVSAVEAILEVDPRLPDEVIATKEVPVKYLSVQHGILRKCGFELKHPKGRKRKLG